MTNTLITWACGHFCILANTTACMSDKDIIDSATEDFWYLATNCDNDLANEIIKEHVICQKNCPKCQEPVGVSIWRNRAIQDINTLRYLHAGSKEMYLETGARYFALDFSQKARYAHHPQCAPAHEQFWISNTLRSDDPLLAPLDDILRLCDQAEAILKTSKTHWEVKQAFVHINTARANVGLMIGSLGYLLDGVELMATARSRSRDKKIRHDDLPSREAMVSIPKAMAWFERMEDWRDKAMEITRDVFGA
jgi:hypothetical protein